MRLMIVLGLGGTPAGLYCWCWLCNRIFLSDQQEIRNPAKTPFYIVPGSEVQNMSMHESVVPDSRQEVCPGMALEQEDN